MNSAVEQFTGSFTETDFTEIMEHNIGGKINNYEFTDNNIVRKDFPAMILLMEAEDRIEIDKTLFLFGFLFPILFTFTLYFVFFFCSTFSLFHWIY